MLRKEMSRAEGSYYEEGKYIKTQFVWIKFSKSVDGDLLPINLVGNKSENIY